MTLMALRIEKLENALTIAKGEMMFAIDKCEEMRIELERVKAERDAWKRAVEGLTPSGSEFVDDPAACAAYIRHTYSPLETFKRLRAQRDELAAALKRIYDGNVMSGHWTHAETVLTYQRIAKEALAKLEDK